MFFDNYFDGFLRAVLWCMEKHVRGVARTSANFEDEEVSNNKTTALLKALLK